MRFVKIKRSGWLTCQLVTACCLMSMRTHAQEERWLIGTGITYCSYIDSPGINLNVTYRVIGNFHVGPDFSAFLNNEVDEDGVIEKRKEVEYNFNVHQLFQAGKVMSIYPLIGTNFSRVIRHPRGADPEKQWITALNAGAGLEFKLKNVRLFFESKWVSQLNKYDLTTGIIF